MLEIERQDFVSFAHPVSNTELGNSEWLLQAHQHCSS
jgi:hypothetical protein